MRQRGALVLVFALMVAGCGGQVPRTSAVATGTVVPTAAPTAPPVTPSPGPTVAQLIGQKLIVRMAGTTPSAALLGRIRSGEIGGVILFGLNITAPAQLTALTKQLQAAAVAGHQPPLLIAVDQEGGGTSRISWAPPTLSPPEMGQNGSAAAARMQGAATGTALLALGINVELAPVADVPASTASFMYQAGRTFSFDATVTATLADAFATGLEASGVMPAMKHFPGLGYAVRNTDSNVVTINASTAALAPGLLPYGTAIAHHVPLIMLSNATYTAYDATNAAGWSSAIGDTLLRGELGFSGVTITDSLDGTAASRGLHSGQLALRAAGAGTDLILLTGSETTSTADYAGLLAQARAGTLSMATLRASYERILALKAGL